MAMLHLKMYKGNWKRFVMANKESRDIKDWKAVRARISRMARVLGR